VKVLIVGGGGREHALAWKLRDEDPGVDLVAAPGNPGIGTLARCRPVAATDIDGLLALAESERPDLTIVGPEAPLALGIVDRFRARRLPIFGPTAAAAAVESSKVFAKELMRSAGVPTARAERHTRADDARRAARELGAPVVIKASGLAAGKGVTVAGTLAEADAAIDAMLTQRVFGAAGAEILVEEHMEGEEVSLLFLTDGEGWLPFLPAQDHKRLLDGDLGPNTGGMGAYAPVYPLVLTTGGARGPGGGQAAGGATDGVEGRWADWRTLVELVAERIVEPTLAALRDRGTPFAGVLYVGVMVTAEGPKVVEFNCRMGDPETQAILPLTGFSLAPLMRAVAMGESLGAGVDGRWHRQLRREHAVTTVVAAAGYPEHARTGDVIRLPSTTPAGVHVFHAGTARAPSGELVTAGGRVLAVTAVAPTLADAQRVSVAYAGAIEFAGKQYRTDIAWRELGRHARAS